MNKLVLILCLGIVVSVEMQAQNKPLTMGVQEEINSTQLGEKRLLNIYLPQDYKADDTVRYAVIYLLDGSMDEDFIHTAGLVQFSNFPWVNRLPKTIVVGIANTDRKRDMTFPTSVTADKKKYPTTGGSAKFISFIEKELQPFIKQHYPVNNESILIGQSLAGLLATEILITKPTLFNKYVIISPSLWWNNGSILDKKMAISSTIPAENITVYIGVGKEGVTPSQPPRVMEVDANILADKIKMLNNKHLAVHFDYLPDDDHATVGHQAMSNAFRKLYNTSKK